MRSGGDGAVILVRKVDVVGNHRLESDEILAQCGDAARESAVELRECLPAHRRRARVDQIRDRLGLQEIEPAIEHCAPSELAGKGWPATGGDAGGEHTTRHGVAAVRRQLQHILACVRVRRDESSAIASSSGAPVSG